MKYEILKDGFGLIYIKDKPYYYVVNKGFCIVEFDEWNFIDISKSSTQLLEKVIIK